MSETQSSPPPPAPVPLHAVTCAADGTALLVKRRPGRPRKVVPTPVLSGDEFKYLEAVGRARNLHSAASPLLRSKKPEELLQYVLAGLAEESASLRWEIEQGLALGRSVEQTMSRRIDCLHKMALTILGMKRLSLGAEMTCGDPRMAIVVNFFLTTVGHVFEGTLPLALATELMSEVQNKLQDWRRNSEPM